MKKIILVVVTILISQTMFAQDTEFKFIDGNGNTYTVSTNKLDYKPITTIESSSGTYSGGEPKSVSIDMNIYGNLVSQAYAIVADNTIHISTKTKGNGTVVIGSKTIFFDGKSDAYSNLLNSLKTLIK